MKKQVYTVPMLLLIVLTLLLSGCAGMQNAQSAQANYPAFPVTNTTSGADANLASGSGNPQPVANQPGGGLSTPGANPPGAGGAAQDPNNPAPPDGTAQKMPLSMQLAFGTLKLEGTSQAITAEQAARLLPLWQEVFTMSQSSDVKTADLELIFTQIQAVMTSEQVTAIQSLTMGREELAVLAKTLGIELLAMPTLTAAQQATMQASGQNGPPPGGGGPGGGNPAPQGTPPAGGAQPPAGGRGSLEKAFYQAVIDLLTQKIQ